MSTDSHLVAGWFFDDVVFCHWWLHFHLLNIDMCISVIQRCVQTEQDGGQFPAAS